MTGYAIIDDVRKESEVGSCTGERSRPGRPSTVSREFEILILYFR